MDRGDYIIFTIVICCSRFTVVFTCCSRFATVFTPVVSVNNFLDRTHHSIKMGRTGQKGGSAHRLQKSNGELLARHRRADELLARHRSSRTL